jgi:hypothetical protein
MALRTVASVLALIALVEGWYILSRRNQVDRFHLLDDSGDVAFDRLSGQLCRTFQPKAKAKAAKPPAPVNLAPSSSGDPILDAITDSSAAENEVRLEFVRGLPACIDVR